VAAGAVVSRPRPNGCDPRAVPLPDCVDALNVARHAGWLRRLAGGVVWAWRAGHADGRRWILFARLGGVQKDSCLGCGRWETGRAAGANVVGVADRCPWIVALSCITAAELCQVVPAWLPFKTSGLPDPGAGCHHGRCRGLECLSACEPRVAAGLRPVWLTCLRCWICLPSVVIKPTTRMPWNRMWSTAGAIGASRVVLAQDPHQSWSSGADCHARGRSLDESLRGSSLRRFRPQVDSPHVLKPHARDTGTTASGRRCSGNRTAPQATARGCLVFRNISISARILFS